jgi:phosphatidylserine decarboxylase
MTDVRARSRPYESFDSFFTRPLAPGRRPVVGGPSELASPADGVLQARGPVERGCRIVVKGRAYDVARLVGGEHDARECLGGQYAVVYLSPRDYHRVHAPVDGPLECVRSLPGECYPVNAIGERCVPDLLVANRRVAFVQESPQLGRVVTVMVAAMVVGRITARAVPGHDVPFGVHHPRPVPSVSRGDELGAFHLGSTVVVLAGPKAPSWQRAPGLIRVGESLSRIG